MSDQAGELASLGQRFLGALVDGIVGLVVTAPVFFLIGAFDMEKLQAGIQPSLGEQAVNAAIGLVIFVILHGYFLSKNGQTIGKKLIGTRIVGANSGQILPFGKVIGLRYVPMQFIVLIPVVGGLVALIGILLIFGAGRQCLHDRIASTQVVKV